MSLAKKEKRKKAAARLGAWAGGGPGVSKGTGLTEKNLVLVHFFGPSVQVHVHQHLLSHAGPRLQSRKGGEGQLCAPRPLGHGAKLTSCGHGVWLRGAGDFMEGSI